MRPRSFGPFSFMRALRSVGTSWDPVPNMASTPRPKHKCTAPICPSGKSVLMQNQISTALVQDGIRLVASNSGKWLLPATLALQCVVCSDLLALQPIYIYIIYMILCIICIYMYITISGHWSTRRGFATFQELHQVWFLYIIIDY